MATYRERREQRAEQLRMWSDSREEKASAAYARADSIASGIPMGQPILVGHHSEKRHRRDIERIENGMRASIEHGRKAEEMRSRADEIERQAANAIYSDDPDAIEQLEAKIAGLEAQRDRIKAYNATCRKAAKAGGVGDTSLLDERQREGLANLAKYCSYQVGKGGAMPAYALSNLGGNIKRLRDRLARLKHESEHGPRDRHIYARFASECRSCGAAIERGKFIRYNHQDGPRCVECES